MDYRERLLNALELREWSQGKLAALSGVSRSHISMFLSGDRREMGFSKVAALARALDVSLDWLAGMPKRNPGELEPDEKELVRLYRTLPPDGQELMFTTMRVAARIRTRSEEETRGREP